jgi:DNA-binding XRE family transcriptional regulator
LNVGKTFGEQLREARLKASAYNEKLATQQGAAEALEVSSPETIGRWERDEVLPSNINARRMAQLYNAPELLTNYCAMICPIGCGRMSPVQDECFERTAIKLFNEAQGVGDVAKALLLIASDGKVRPDEVTAFQDVVKKLGSLKTVIDALQIYAEKNGL